MNFKGLGFAEKKTIESNNVSQEFRVLLQNALIGFLGGTTTIYLLSILTNFTQELWLMAPFGASCVLAFSAHDAKFSQPKNIIGGHVISTLTGLAMLYTFGQAPWVIGVAVGLAISLMVMTKTVHPPAGADPIVVILSNSSWSFLFTPVLTGSIIIVLFAYLINNLSPSRQYPLKKN